MIWPPEETDDTPELPSPVARKVASFRVFGEPRTKGSAVGFVATDANGRWKKTKKGAPRVTITNDCAFEKRWRRAVEKAARPHCPPDPLLGPVEVIALFYLPRAETTNFPDWPIGQNAKDLDKLLRSIGDALNADKIKKGAKAGLRRAGFYKDDSQVVHWDSWKVYGDPGCYLWVNDLSAQLSLFP